MSLSEGRWDMEIMIIGLAIRALCVRGAGGAIRMKNYERVCTASRQVQQNLGIGYYGVWS